MLWFPSPASLSPAQDFKLMNSVRKMNDTWIWRKKKEAIWCTWIIKAGSAPSVRRSGSRHHTSTVKALQQADVLLLRLHGYTVLTIYRGMKIGGYHTVCICLPVFKRESHMRISFTHQCPVSLSSLLHTHASTAQKISEI